MTVSTRRSAGNAVFSRTLLLITVILASLSAAELSHAQAIVPGYFDIQTRAQIATAARVVYLVPFSHWDTDWHDTYANYSRFADQNILKAIQLGKQYPGFRYSLEQVLFVQHFWETHPESREDLRTLIQNHQITFLWAGITQPDTSLVAPMVQIHNYQLGRNWITQTFGAAYVPHSAWQSDAFGNSAAFPSFLQSMGIANLFIGRGKARCAAADAACKPLPPAFFWRGPATSAGAARPILTTYIPYDYVWSDIYHVTDPAAQLQRLRVTIEGQFSKTPSQALVLPIGFDFADPQENLMSLVEQWNTADKQTLLVLADPESAFQNLATQPLPEMTVDLNPIWQAFYATRPFAKIADKETEYYLTTADKFSALYGGNAPDWTDAAVNAHYDNIAGVGFDSVWNASQRPRYDDALARAKDALRRTLGSVVSRTPVPLVAFNPSSWARSGIFEVQADQVDPTQLPQPIQLIGPNTLAFRIENVPPLGYLGINGGQGTIHNPARVDKQGNQITLSNGLVAVTIQGDRGATFSSMLVADGAGGTRELINGDGDELIYYEDNGDVYGAFFGAVKARESAVLAQVEVIADGPLVARVQARFSLGGKVIIKTITVRADEPLITVAIDLETLKDSTALIQMSTRLDTAQRTDDLGFGAILHTIDTRPIVSGDVTYRRQIFYPFMYWNDVSTAQLGLSVITHGLQGIAGSTSRALMLVREVTKDPEGATDPGVHHLQYAYLPHVGSLEDARPWQAAYAFNGPLILAWRTNATVTVQIPFDALPPHPLQITALPADPLPPKHGISAEDAIIADLYRSNGQLQAVILNYQSRKPVIIQLATAQVPVLPGPLDLVNLPD